MVAGFDRDRLIIGLYEAVGDTPCVATAIGEISAALSAVAAQALVIEKATGRVLENVSHGGDVLDTRFEDYDRYWRHRDPRFSAAARAPGEILSDVAVIDPGVFERSAICNELLLPSGVRYTLFGNFDAGTELTLALAFMRPSAAGGFQDPEVQRVRSIRSHVSAALRAHTLVATLSAERRDLRAALDRVPSAIAILDARGRVRSANRAAEELLAKADGLTTRHGVLSATRPADARQLAAHVADAVALATVRARTSARSNDPSLVVRRERGAPLVVALFPLFERSVGVVGGRVLAVIHDPDRIVMLDPELVARLYGLTATEAELAVALVAGRSLTNFAAERGCSEQTARTHLKRVFAKTGFTRQPDLVRALLTGAALHGALGST